GGWWTLSIKLAGGSRGTRARCQAPGPCSSRGGDWYAPCVRDLPGTSPADVRLPTRRSCMSRILPLSLIALTVATPGAAVAQTPRFVLELEGGAVWQSYNDAEIPNDGSATRFSLSELTGGGPWPAGRAYLTWNLGERHGLRVLAAPLSLTETGVPDAPIDFEGERFAAGVPLAASYTFDSYRLTYRYRVRATPRTTAWVGFTAKVRDATVELEQGAIASRKENVGLVPLLHLAGEWRAAPRWRVSLDADALAGGPGRAIDA